MKRDSTNGKAGARLPRLALFAGAAALALCAAIALGLALFGKPAIRLLAPDSPTAQAFSTLVAKPEQVLPALLRVEAGAKPAAAFLDGLSRNEIAVFRVDRSLGRRGAKLAPLPTDILAKYPPHILALLSSGGQPELLPLLFDEAVLGYDAARLASWGLSPIDSLEALERALAAAKQGASGSHVLLVAGGEDEILLGLLSALVAARGGTAAYRDLSAAIFEVSAEAGPEGPKLAILLDRPLGAKAASGSQPDQSATSLREALDRLGAWTRAGYLHSDWLDMKSRDVALMFKSRAYPFFFTYLSEERAFDRDFIEGFKTLPFPLGSGRPERFLIAPITVAALHAKAGDRTRALFARLSDKAVQEALARASGKAPASASPQAADIQARDARAYAYSTQDIVQGLYADAFEDRAKAAAFAGLVRDWLREAGRERP